MKKIYYFLFLLTGVLSMTSCLKDDNDYVDYEAWRVENEAFFNHKKDSIDPETKEPYYKEIASLPYPEYKVLYHEITPGKEGGRIPFYTSTVKVDYSGHLFNTQNPFDQQTGSLFKISDAGLINGWKTVLQQMPEGAKWEVIIPWQLAYGINGSLPKIPPYSALVFTIDLVEITKWEVGRGLTE
ncbi:MAG: FKBP-type peptidyl-prolyl cis-trans isomerase [Bacteroidales bacterium]